MKPKEIKINDQIYSLKNNEKDYDYLLDLIGDAQYVFIGESTHGTQEFYQTRIELSKRLIAKKGFNAIAIEGDWPDTYNIHRYVQGNSKIKTSLESLKGFNRFPTWMWRNEAIIEFIDWLYEYNQAENYNKIGFYGLDLYSLNSSIKAIIHILEKYDPEAAKRAKNRYSCFGSFHDQMQNYGYETKLGISKSCENEVMAELIELHDRHMKSMKENIMDKEDLFFIEQNALLVKNAEHYYRTMFDDSISSWNIRDNHMIEVLENISQYLKKKSENPAKIIVWAHNSHIGDARATQMGEVQKEVNLGQLAREKYGNKVFLLGLTTYTGTVTAASNWDEMYESKVVIPALSESYEEFLQKLNLGNIIINLKDPQILNLIPAKMLERAIGVIYRPETERMSHYFYAELSKQFDGLIYFDHTNALKAIDNKAFDHFDEYETYPSGL